MSIQRKSTNGQCRGLEPAIELAVKAHRGQDYPGPMPEPYVLHLFRVMLAVEGEPAQMAAVLHDVLEDTTVTAGDLRTSGIPSVVIDAVVALTHHQGDSYDDYVERVAENELARRVKLADLADNLANNERLPRTAEVAARMSRYERAIRRLSIASATNPKETHMVKLVVAYGAPEDPAAFDEYYAATHTPLVHRIPNLRRFEAGKILGTPDGSTPPYYLLAELWFDDLEALQASMASPEGAAAGNDLPNFASGGATLMIAEG